jgi:hypothetical protein
LEESGEERGREWKREEGSEGKGAERKTYRDTQLPGGHGEGSSKGLGVCQFPSIASSTPLHLDVDFVGIYSEDTGQVGLDVGRHLGGNVGLGGVRREERRRREGGGKRRGGGRNGGGGRGGRRRGGGRRREGKRKEGEVSI